MFNFFKKKNEKTEEKIKERIDSWNTVLDTEKINRSLEKNIEICKTLFADADIIRYREISSKEDNALRYFLVFCDGMVNSEIINSNIVKPLLSREVSPEINLNSLLTVIPVGEAKEAESFRCIVESVLSGDTVLFAQGCNQALIFNTKNLSFRSICEPDNEKVLVGPREGFTESLMQNLSQVVRRAHTYNLKTKMLSLGKQTKTAVCICYFDNIADKNVLKELMERLEKIDIDGVLDSNYITEIIKDHRYSPFRTTGYTERPDTVVGKLLEGRIAIFVDGSPMILTVPYLFIENFQSSEDYYFIFFYSSFARMLRICAFILTVTIPAFYISTVAYHQEMLPLHLLMQIALERQSVPLPAALEAVIMLIVFDVLRETGIRMPSNIGQALSIVGALVIGQAAVEASLVAAPMIIVVAATGITGLLVPKLNASIILWRFFLILLASMFGFYGFTAGVSLMVIHINNLTSFGVEQIGLNSSFRFQANKDILIRAPWSKMIDRPENLTSNETRQTGDDGHA